MKQRTCLLKCLAVIASMHMSSIVWAPPKGDVWVRKHTPMPTKRVGFSTSAVNGKIYAIGGTLWDGEPRHGRVLRTVEEYDPVTNQWKIKEGMRAARSFLAASAANGKIYAIGGSVQLFWDRKHVEEFNPATDTWENKADMLVPRSDHFANTVDGKIYVIGGASDGLVEEYDPVADRWGKKSAMPKRRYVFATSAVDGKIYVIGGARWNPARILATVEAYDPATDTWETKPTCQRRDLIYLRQLSMGLFTRLAGLLILVFEHYRQWKRTTLQRTRGKRWQICPREDLVFPPVR